jgi:hypothetical protein
MTLLKVTTIKTRSKIVLLIKKVGVYGGLGKSNSI